MLASSGSKSTGSLTEATSFSLVCNGAGGMSQGASVSVNIVPTASLTAAPISVGTGGTSTLTWSSTNATGCTGSGGWSGSLAPSGSKSSGALSSTTTFSLICAGPGGNSAPARAVVSVTAVPTATLSAYPTVVAPGGLSTLTWSSLNASSCVASGAWSGSLAGSGSQSTGALNTSANYSLRCSGSSGSSALVSATVTVSSTAMSVSPATTALTLTRTQQFTATVPGGGLATWTVDGVAGGNGTVGSISSGGLYTAGTAAGAHTVVATSVANTTQNASAVAAVTDLAGVYTYHNDLARDGANTQEYALTKSTVTAAHFGKRAACAVDGAIYAQPLWVANLSMQGIKHNVVFVATQHNGLFAFDADASPCSGLWSVNLIDATHGGSAGETSVPGNLVGQGFGDIQPEVGVTGTPVIDPAKSILYVVTKSVNAGHTAFYQRLHAIDLATGTEKPGSPVTIAGVYPGTGDHGSTVTFNAQGENQRAGLALVNGIVYIAWAAHEDAAPWYGWIMGYQYSGTALTRQSIFNTAPNAGKAGVWMGGGAPAADSSNHIYVVTGNGGFDATSGTAPNNDYGDTLLQLSSTLSVSQWFTPSDQLADAQNDDDFGAGGAALLADLPAGNTVTHALICGGKDAALYVINRDLLGGFGDPASVQRVDIGAPILSTGALWNNRLYLAGIDFPLQAYQLNTATAQFSKTSASSHSFPDPGATPSVSAAAAQDGIVWSLDIGTYCTSGSGGCGPAVLYAYDATNLANELWDSSQNATDAAGNAVKFTVPTVANGRVYVGTRGNNKGGASGSTSTAGELDIYGLKP